MGKKTWLFLSSFFLLNTQMRGTSKCLWKQNEADWTYIDMLQVEFYQFTVILTFVKFAQYKYDKHKYL